MKSPAAQPIDQTLGFRILLAVLLAGVAVLLWAVICTVPGIPWNPARLAPSFALVRGLPIYALRDSGAQLGWIYGPVFPLWYLPVALTDNPTLAHMLAAWWNALTFLLPLAWVLRQAQVARPWSMLVVAAVLLLGHDITRGYFYFIHVDAVCLAWGLIACVALQRAAQGGRSFWLHLAAISVALAFWSKQLAIMMYPAMLGWLWWEGYRPLARRFLVWSVIYGALITAVFFSMFGAAELLFNAGLRPGRTPWSGGLPLLVTQFADLGVASAVWLPLLLGLLWLRRRAGGMLMTPTAASLVRLLLWVALWELPLGLSAQLRAGGALNSLHSLHFIFAAGLIGPAAILTRSFALPDIRRPLVLAGLALALLLPLASAFVLAHQHAVWWPHRGQERLLEMARAQPGRYYFPWNPLITIISDRRVYPFDDALYCLWLDGLEVPTDKVRAAVPHDPIILYEEPAQSHFALRYFPGHKP